MMPVFVPISHSSSPSGHGLSMPSSVVYFLKKGTDPKEYVDQAFLDAFPGYKVTEYEYSNHGYKLQRSTGMWRDDTDDVYVYLRYTKQDKVSIITVNIMNEDGEALPLGLAFAYSLDKILASANVLLQE